MIEAIRQITTEEVAIYPDYAALSRECADYLGVRETQLVLTNGLDEGLLAATVSGFRVMQGSASLPEAVIPQPAFEMYQVFVRAAGGRIVPIPPKPGFAFPTREICDAITPRTRIIFPDEPEQSDRPADPARGAARHCALRAARRHDRPRRGVLRFLRRNVPPGARRASERDHRPDVREGARPGRAAGRLPDWRSLSGSTRSATVPPYSLSVFAVAGWRAALRDREYLAWYRTQVEESRELLYAACERLHLPYWKSAGNFVLINVGAVSDPAELVEALASRGILVRDRSKDPGCGGCIRITAGLVRHTEIVIEALEGLCAVP